MLITMALKLSIFMTFLAVNKIAHAEPTSNVTKTFRNPIIDGPSSDPHIYRHTHGIYYWARSIGNGVEVLRSRKLSNWRNAYKREVFHVQEPYGAVWTPEIHFIRGNFYIYFSMAQNSDNVNQRMYVIKANDPKDPLGDYGQPVQLRAKDSDFRAVDGTVMQYSNAQLYFIWSGWPGTETGGVQNLYIAWMKDPMEISSERIVLHEPGSDWEKIGFPNNQAPEVLEHDGQWFLFFSASANWSPDSCVGMIGIDGGKDPLVRSNWWQDVDRCVFWRNDQQSVYCVGHTSFTKSPDGTEPWVVYHARDGPGAGLSNRTTRAEKIRWNPDRSPGLPRHSGLSNDIPIPSGE